MKDNILEYMKKIEDICVCGDWYDFALAYALFERADIEDVKELSEYTLRKLKNYMISLDTNLNDDLSDRIDETIGDVI